VKKWDMELFKVNSQTNKKEPPFKRPENVFKGNVNGGSIS